MFEKVARESEIREGKGKRITAGETDLALWRVEGTIYAIGCICPHQHLPVLHEGILSGLSVTCPMHGWCYSLESGEEEHRNGRVRTFSVKIENGDVLIDLPDTHEEISLFRDSGGE